MEDQRVGAAGAVRPSDADREVVEARLKTAVADGRLTLEEFADRMGFALSAESSDELSRVTSDLPAVRGAQVPAVSAPGRTRGRATQRWLVAVLGGFSTSRRWRPARTTNAVAVMGGGEVDLRSAEIEGDEITINATAVMGGIEVIVPRGVDVEMGGFAFMGGRECTVDESSLVEGAPLVRVNGYALMGGIEVRNETEKEARKRAAAEGREPEPGHAGHVPQTLHRTEAGPNDQKSWWGKLALGIAAIAFVANGGVGVVADAIPSGMTVMSSRSIDATGIAAGDTRTIEAGALMGSVEIEVDPGTTVLFESFALMGSQDDDGVAPAAAGADAGTLVVDGGVVMGSIEVASVGGEGTELQEQLQALEEARDVAEDAGVDTGPLDDQIEALEERVDDLD